MTVDTPIIKAFTIKKRYYVYDTYTNYLLRVDKDIYHEICKLQQIGVGEYKKLDRTDSVFNNTITLLDKGLFRPSFIERIEHPDTKYLPQMIERCMNQLILGITNSCNFKCRYCHQAEGKLLSNQKMMDEETAFKSVDYLYKHSKDAFGVTITFYGGEPLLNFKLIKSTVRYAHEKFKTKIISFNTTTNASLLCDEIVDFLADNNFSLMISLDGDAKIQNMHRKFLQNGGDTFDLVWKNVMHLREKHPDYFNSKVIFNAVKMQDERSEDVMRFFRENGISEALVSVRKADMNGIDYSLSPLSLKTESDDNHFDFDDEAYKVCLQHYEDKVIIPTIWHHNGPCVPAVRRIFINADGKFYPCEKIDSDPSCCIGNLDSGVNIQKAAEILNIGKLTERECKECWAIRFCTMCVHDCIGDYSWSRLAKLQHCEIQKKNALEFLKEYAEKSFSRKEVQ